MARRRSRHGQQSWSIWFKLFKFAVVVALLGAIAFYAYEVGQRLGLEQVAELRQQIEGLTTAEASAREEATRLQSELDIAKKRADEFEVKYAAIAPSDDMKEILGAVKAKLASGLDPKRLAFVVQAAEKPRRCSSEENKRFMVKTARYDGNSTWVRFSDLITVTAEGTGTSNGADEAFDTEKPVTVKFTIIGGKEVHASGKLPLQHSLVAKGFEYRFTVAPGAKGFVEVTGDRCDYKG